MVLFPEIESGDPIDLIPMIDIMFFLLVFFMILTLRMIPDQGLGLALPQASTAKTLPHPHILIGIAQSGAIEVNHDHLAPQALAAWLAGQAKRKPVVTIAAARGVPFQDFVRVMNAARKAGITSIGIAARP